MTGQPASGTAEETNESRPMTSETRNRPWAAQAERPGLGVTNRLSAGSLDVNTMPLEPGHFQGDHIRQHVPSKLSTGHAVRSAPGHPSLVTSPLLSNCTPVSGGRVTGSFLDVTARSEKAVRLASLEIEPCKTAGNEQIKAFCHNCVPQQSTISCGAFYAADLGPRLWA